MTFINSQQAYAVSVGTTPTQNHVFRPRAPTVNDIQYSVGTFWNNTANSTLWYLASQSSPGGNLQSNWIELTQGGSTAIETLTPDSGGVVSPVSNNVNIHGIDGITTTNGGSGTLTIGFSGSSFLVNSKVTLTSAQVKALAETPITIIPAPGPGNVIFFVNDSCLAKLIYGGTNAFTNVNDLDIAYYDGSSFYGNVHNSVAFLGQTTSVYRSLTGPVTGNFLAATSMDNLPIVIYNTGSDITGNAAGDNQLEIQFQYVVLTF